MADPLEHYTINFNLNGKPKQFDIVTNIRAFGLDVYAAFENWHVRTEKYDIQSFCKYVVSKAPTYLICMPKDEFRQ